MEAFNAGTLVGAGSFLCDSCGFGIALHERDPVPICPECGGTSFRRASLFGDDIRRPRRHEVDDVPDWLDEAREALMARAAVRFLPSSHFGRYAASGRRWPTIKTSAACAAAMKARRAFSLVRYPHQACMQTWPASRQHCLPAFGQ